MSVLEGSCTGDVGGAVCLAELGVHTRSVFVGTERLGVRMRVAVMGESQVYGANASDVDWDGIEKWVLPPRQLKPSGGIAPVRAR